MATLPFSILSVNKVSLPMLSQTQFNHLQNLYLRHGSYIPYDTYKKTINHNKHYVCTDTELDINIASYCIARDLVYWDTLRNFTNSF